MSEISELWVGKKKKKNLQRWENSRIKGLLGCHWKKRRTGRKLDKGVYSTEARLSGSWIGLLFIGSLFFVAFID
jgi:hypothetical protein